MKLFWRILYPAFISSIFTTIAMILWPRGDALTLTLIGTACAIPVLGWLYFKDRRRQGRSAVSIPPVHLLVVAVFGISCCLLFNNLIAISHLGDVFPGYTEVLDSLYAPPFWMQLLVVGLVIPIGEELVFRGLAFGRLREKTGFYVAALFSSLFFAIYHGNVVQGVYALFLGLGMCLVYETYQTLTAPIVFHMSANMVSVLLTELAEEEVFGEGISLYVITAISGCVAVLATYTIEKRRKIR